MRETKYNQHTNQRKAPIDREGLWTQISNDPKFPTPEPKSRKRFWIFGGLGLLVLLAVAAIAWPILTKNNTTTHNELSSNIQESEKNELIINKNNTSQTLEVTSSSDELEKDTKNEIEKVITPTQKKTLVTQPQTPQTFKESSTDIGPEPTPNLTQSHLNPITTVQPNKTTIENKVIPSSKNTGSDNTASQNEKELLNYSDGLNTQFNSIAGLDQIDHRLNLPHHVKDYQRNLVDTKSKIGLLAYANVSYGLSLHNVTVSEKPSQNDSLGLDPNMTDYLKNRESRAIEIGLKKTLFKRYRLGFGVELRQDWQAYRRTTSEIGVARDSMLILAGYSQQMTTTDYTLHQKYQSVNLNVSLDRIIPLGWAYLELGAGLAYRVEMTSKGDVLNLENRLIDRVESYPLNFKGSISGFGQLGLTMPLTEDWRLSFNARYNMPNLLSSDTDDYIHKLSALRFGLGLGYEF